MDTGETRVHFMQGVAPSQDKVEKYPVVMPIRWQVVGDNGPLSEPQLNVLTSAATSVSYPKINQPHSLSILQDFSAPVTLQTNFKPDDLIRLMGADPNPFNRWEAGQALARLMMMGMANAIENGTAPAPNKALSGYCKALERTLTNPHFNNNFKALALTPPSPSEVLQNFDKIDPIACLLYTSPSPRD